MPGKAGTKNGAVCSREDGYPDSHSELGSFRVFMLLASFVFFLTLFSEGGGALRKRIISEYEWASQEFTRSTKAKSRYQKTKIITGACHRMTTEKSIRRNSTWKITSLDPFAQPVWAHKGIRSKLYSPPDRLKPSSFTSTSLSSWNARTVLTPCEDGREDRFRGGIGSSQFEEKSISAAMIGCAFVRLCGWFGRTRVSIKTEVIRSDTNRSWSKGAFFKTRFYLVRFIVTLHSEESTSIDWG